MKRLQITLALGLLVAGMSSTSAESWSLNQFKPHVLPVLVQVNSAGKVTSVSPADKLTPAMDRLLRSSLDEMITGPAMDHGRPMASQFVMNLALATTPRDSGDYDARFAYVSTSPVPPGSWYWQHEDGHRLALINRNGLDNMRRNRSFDRYYDRQPSYRVPTQRFNNTNRSSAPAQTASRSEPVKGR